METKALYIHIPFCDHICSYCDFAKVYYLEEFVLKYLERLKEELDALPHHIMRTIYIGGGTPSALSLKQLDTLLSMIDSFVGDDTLEYTIEVNPESATLDKLECMYTHGVNRISAGVQTFNNDLLKKRNVHLFKKSERSTFFTIQKTENIIGRRIPCHGGRSKGVNRGLKQSIGQINDCALDPGRNPNLENLF